MTFHTRTSHDSLHAWLDQWTLTGGRPRVHYNVYIANCYASYMPAPPRGATVLPVLKGALCYSLLRRLVLAAPA